MLWFPAREPGHADTQSATNSPWAPRYSARHTMMCRSEPSSRSACAVASGPSSGEHGPETGGSTPPQSCVGVFFQESQLLENPWQTLKSTNTLGVQDFHLPRHRSAVWLPNVKQSTARTAVSNKTPTRLFAVYFGFHPKNQTTPKPVMVMQLLFIC